MRSAFRLLAAVMAMACAGPLTALDHTADTLPVVKANVEKQTAVLVDVREQREWDAGHIEGAVFLPLSHVQAGLSDQERARLPQDKILYLHCAAGVRSLNAGTALEKLGYQVRPLRPGYQDLLKAGFAPAKP